MTNWLANWKSLIRRSLADSSGFTLVEVLFSVGILSLAVGIVGSGIFQVTAVRKHWADDAVATKDLRHAGSWSAGDALNAKVAQDANGDTLACTPPNPGVTLIWTDTNGASRRATYSASAGRLVRQDEDGNSIQVIPGGVVDNSVKFSLCGNLLTLDLEVKAERENIETMVLRTYLRKLKP